MTFSTRCSICRCLIDIDTYVFYCIRIFVLLRFHTSSHHKPLTFTVLSTYQPSFVIISHTQYTHTHFHSSVKTFLAHCFSSQIAFASNVFVSTLYVLFSGRVCVMNLKIGNEIGEFWWIFATAFLTEIELWSLWQEVNFYTCACKLYRCYDRSGWELDKCAHLDKQRQCTKFVQ